MKKPFMARIAVCTTYNSSIVVMAENYMDAMEYLKNNTEWEESADDDDEFNGCYSEVKTPSGVKEIICMSQLQRGCKGEYIPWNSDGEENLKDIIENNRDKIMASNVNEKSLMKGVVAILEKCQHAINEVESKDGKDAFTCVFEDLNKVISGKEVNV